MNKKNARFYLIPAMLVVLSFSFAKYASADWQTGTNSNDIIHAKTDRAGTLFMQGVQTNSIGSYRQPIGFVTMQTSTSTIGALQIPICATEIGQLQVRVYRANNSGQSQIFYNGNGDYATYGGTLIATLPSLDLVPSCSGFSGSASQWTHFSDGSTHTLSPGNYYYILGTVSTATADFSQDYVNGLGWSFSTYEFGTTYAGIHYDYHTYASGNTVYLNPLFALYNVTQVGTIGSDGACTGPYGGVFGNGIAVPTGYGPYYVPCGPGGDQSTYPAIYYPDFEINGSVYSPLPVGTCGADTFSCTVGTSTNNVTGTSTNTWNCNAEGGIASCSSSVSAADGTCGYFPFTCLVGQSVNNVTNTASFDWNCNGINGGSPVSCTSAFFVATTTVTASFPTYTPADCGITSGAEITGCIKNALSWAVLPPQSVFNQFSSLMDTLKKKAPIGYFVAIKETFVFDASSSTSSIQVLVQPDNPLMSMIFTPLRGLLLIVMYIYAGVWLYKRVKDIHI